jgi:hypothetical protein
LACLQQLQPLLEAPQKGQLSQQLRKSLLTSQQTHYSNRWVSMHIKMPLSISQEELKPAPWGLLLEESFRVYVRPSRVILARLPISRPVAIKTGNSDTQKAQGNRKAPDGLIQRAASGVGIHRINGILLVTGTIILGMSGIAPGGMSQHRLNKQEGDNEQSRMQGQHNC